MATWHSTVWQRLRTAIVLVLGIALLYCVYLGGVLVYDRLTRSPARWNARMKDAQTLANSGTAKGTELLDASRRALREARKFGRNDPSWLKLRI